MTWNHIYVRGETKAMAWSRRTSIRRPQAWAATGAYRELVRRLPRCAGSWSWLSGAPGAWATWEEAEALAGWRGSLAPE